MRYSNPYDIGTFFQPRLDVSFGKNAIVQWMVIIIFSMNLLTIAGLWFYVDSSVALIKLQYNVYFGTSLFVAWWGAYILPAMGFLFFLLDVFLAFILYSIKERIFAYSILLGAFFVQVALVVAVYSIVLNNYL